MLSAHQAPDLGDRIPKGTKRTTAFSCGAATYLSKHTCTHAHTHSEGQYTHNQIQWTYNLSNRWWSRTSRILNTTKSVKTYRSLYCNHIYTKATAENNVHTDPYSKRFRVSQLPVKSTRVQVHHALLDVCAGC